MAVRDLYFLALHEPYPGPPQAPPINATIVHAATLLHPALPQPDGGRIYRCLTEAPGRVPGELVPLATLTFELDGGNLWPQVADWERVVDAVVRISRDRGCDAMPIGLPHVPALLLSGGPATTHTLHHPDGSTSRVGPDERQQQLAELTGHVRQYVAEDPFWPGDGLLAPPAQPPAMPYRLPAGQRR
ncbi:hypothetical protein L3Q67_45430 (plasmid) [Saccharothrix sp. AJ9571]|nr:hypothetical protein L3Q67_45430 [Saccharothrix sp. AJ9571]